MNRSLPASRTSLGAAVLSLSASLLGCTGGITDVYLSPDASGERRVEKLGAQVLPTFTAEARAVHCIVEYSNGREDATIDGIIRQEAVQLPDGSMSANRDVIVAAMNVPAAIGDQNILSVALLPLDPATGQTSDTTPLPAGRYRCEFALRNTPPAPGTAPQPDMSAQFDVAPLECPTTQIFNGKSCSFYPAGKICAADGSRSNKLESSPECRCMSNAWECERAPR